MRPPGNWICLASLAVALLCDLGDGGGDAFDKSHKSSQFGPADFSMNGRSGKSEAVHNTSDEGRVRNSGGEQKARVRGAMFLGLENTYSSEDEDPTGHCDKNTAAPSAPVLITAGAYSSFCLSAASSAPASQISI